MRKTEKDLDTKLKGFPLPALFPTMCSANNMDIKNSDNLMREPHSFIFRLKTDFRTTQLLNVKPSGKGYIFILVFILPRIDLDDIETNITGYRFYIIFFLFLSNKM